MAGINSPEDFPGIPPMAFGDPGGYGGSGGYGGGGGGGGGGSLPPPGGGNFVNGLPQGIGVQPTFPWSPSPIRRRVAGLVKGGAPMAPGNPFGGQGASQASYQPGVNIPFSGGGQPMSAGGGGGGGGWWSGLVPQQQAPQGPQQPFNPQTEQFGSVIDILNNLITHGVRGDMPGYGGAFSLNPPQGILDAMRQQQVSDAGAQNRAARLSIRQDPNADPSTYGFQSLMSQLQGQSNTSRNMAQADAGLRQQQLQNYWNLLSTLYGGHQGALNTIASQPQQQSGWGSFLGGLGNLIGSGVGAIRGGNSSQSQSGGGTNQWNYPYAP